MNRNDFLTIFRAILSLVVLGWALRYLWAITFVPQGMELSKYTEVIVGFTLGTTVSALLGYYFGGKDKDPAERRDRATIFKRDISSFTTRSDDELPDTGNEVIRRDVNDGEGDMDDERI